MRGSGILLHISSLPGPYGIGSLGKEAFQFVDFLKAAGQKYWQVLPLGPTSYGDSPYQTLSAFAGNPYFIDLEVLVEKGFLSKAEITDLPKKDTSYVDFNLQYRQRFLILKRAFSNFTKTNADHQAFHNFKKEQDWLGDYSLYMAIKTKHHGDSWDLWPEPFKYRHNESLKEFCADHQEEIEFWNFLQFEFYQEWEALKTYAHEQGIVFIGDMPIYVAYDSADVWSRPEYWLLDEKLQPQVVAGVPPDQFTKDGQLWGNPLYNYPLMEKDNYSWWIKRISHGLKTFDYLRIDHFRGFESYYSIPFGEKTARKGKWVKGPGMKLFSLVKEAIKSPAIIAEDLGYLTLEVREMLAACGFPGMKILQFGFDAGGDSEYAPHNHSKNSIVYPGTHDNPTTKSWVKTLSLKDYQYLKDYLQLRRKSEVVKYMIRECFKSVCDTCIIQMQDYLELDDRARFNKPSTLGGNWIWRVNRKNLNSKLAKEISRLVNIYRR
ncbi:MAG: 4-alpha-glucanotransferase [Bacilli bacterium]|nr:4-alpha-glucanotransferase [Bacilli bacterium]